MITRCEDFWFERVIFPAFLTNFTFRELPYAELIMCGGYFFICVAGKQQQQPSEKLMQGSGFLSAGYVESNPD